jgi:hypothetical protein
MMFFFQLGFLKLTLVPGTDIPPIEGSEAETDALLNWTGGAVGGVVSNEPGCGIANWPLYESTKFGCHGAPTATGTQQAAAPFKLFKTG